jgi:hypothetical protein
MAVTTVREAILREIETLPEAKQTDVLAFIRFLRIGLVDEQTVEQRFTDALVRGRTIAQERGITERDVSEEVQAARSQP